MDWHTIVLDMAQETLSLPARCFNCGFEAPPQGDQWKRVNHPPLGTLMQCPECGSTDIRNRR